MKIRWWYILLSLVLVLLPGFAYLNQAFFQAYFIQPIANILWLVYRTFLAVDQEAYWGLLILITLILILSMIPNQKISYRPAYRNSGIERDRVKDWEILLKAAEESEYDRLKLQHYLEIINPSVGDPDEENDEDDINLPAFREDIRRQVRSAWRSSFISRIIRRERNAGFTELEKHVETMVGSMETQLEIKNDGKSNRNQED